MKELDALTLHTKDVAVGDGVLLAVAVFVGVKVEVAVAVFVGVGELVGVPKCISVGIAVTTGVSVGVAGRIVGEDVPTANVTVGPPPPPPPPPATFVTRGSAAVSGMTAYT